MPSAAEVSEALRLSQEPDLQIVLGANIDEAIAKIGKFGKPVVLASCIEVRETDEDTQKQKKTMSGKTFARK